jgi:hypothetical protein
LCQIHVSSEIDEVGGDRSGEFGRLSGYHPLGRVDAHIDADELVVEYETAGESQLGRDI